MRFIKEKARGVAVGSLKSALLVELRDEMGIDIDSHMTPNIEEKLEDLLGAVIDDIGYINLYKIAKECI